MPAPVVCYGMAGSVLRRIAQMRQPLPLEGADRAHGAILPVHTVPYCLCTRRHTACAHAAILPVHTPPSCHYSPYARCTRRTRRSTDGAHGVCPVSYTHLRAHETEADL
eukprot:510715-Rhodomonas_salina.1